VKVYLLGDGTGASSMASGVCGGDEEEKSQPQREDEEMAVAHPDPTDGGMEMEKGWVWCTGVVGRSRRRQAKRERDGERP
jgi:hypothetical protein